jgi:hypothetical protein
MLTRRSTLAGLVVVIILIVPALLAVTAVRRSNAQEWLPAVILLCLLGGYVQLSLVLVPLRRRARVEVWARLRGVLSAAWARRGRVGTATRAPHPL